MHPRAAHLVRTLGLAPHPEGGFYREVFRAEPRVVADGERGERSAMTSIYFLLAAGAVSRWHRVRSDEAWHLYEGDGLELLQLTPDLAGASRHRLGPVDGDGSDGGGAPVHVVPAHAWQAARPLGPYALVGCTVAPGFEFADFAMLADDAPLAGALRERWPDLAALL